MKIRTMIFAALAFFSANAFAVHCEVNISLSGGGSGTATYDSAVGCNADLSSVSNLLISITVGGTTWTQSQISSKYGTQPYGNLYFGGASCGQSWWDDPDNGSGDTAIVTFTNGQQVLTFDEGDLGTFTYSINGQPAGTYSVFISCTVAKVPTLSPWSLALLVLLLAGMTFFGLRARRAR